MPTAAASATRSLATAALVVAAATSLVASPAQAAPSKVCPKHTTEVARKANAVFWTDKGKLWNCTTSGGRMPQNRVLGPWTKGKSQIILGDGTVMGWTYRTKVAGKTADLVMGADIGVYGPNPVFVKASRPTIGPGSSTDLRVAAMVAGGPGIGWVTQGGRVVIAYAGAVQHPEPIGAGTPGAADAQADGTVGTGGGLLATPLQKGKRLLLGRWTSIAPAALADTLAFENLGGESDDCGGGYTYDATVVPVEGQPKVGVRASVSVTYDGPACG